MCASRRKTALGGDEGPEQAKALFERYDKNGDGKRAPDEVKALLFIETRGKARARKPDQADCRRKPTGRLQDEGPATARLV